MVTRNGGAKTESCRKLIAARCKITVSQPASPSLGWREAPVTWVGRSTAWNWPLLPHSTVRQSGEPTVVAKHRDSSDASTSMMPAASGSTANLVTARASVMSTQPCRVALATWVVSRRESPCSYPERYPGAPGMGTRVGVGDVVGTGVGGSGVGVAVGATASAVGVGVGGRAVGTGVLVDRLLSRPLSPLTTRVGLAVGGGGRVGVTAARKGLAVGVGMPSLPPQERATSPKTAPAAVSLIAALGRRPMAIPFVDHPCLWTRRAAVSIHAPPTRV